MRKSKNARSVRDLMTGIQDRLGSDVDVSLTISQRPNRRTCKLEPHAVVSVTPPRRLPIELSVCSTVEPDPEPDYWLIRFGVMGALVSAHEELDRVERESRRASLFDALVQ